MGSALMLMHTAWGGSSERSPQKTRAPGQDLEDLGPALMQFCHITLADSLPSLGLSFPTCTMGLAAFNSPPPRTFHEPTDDLV